MITLAMSRPKNIDLDSYGIGEVILGLFASGGGTLIMENMKQFWSDISTNRALRLEMNYSEFRFVIDQCARMFFLNGGAAVQLSYGFLVADQTGESYNVSVAISRRDEKGDGNDIKAIIKVKVA